MFEHPVYRYGHHKRRHSLFGIAAVCLIAALVIVGPFLWPLPKTTPNTPAKPQVIAAEHARFGHDGPALPAFFGNLTVTGAPISAADAAQLYVQRAGQAAYSQDVSATPSLTFSHLNVTSTWFWVGEPADASNDYISNSPSAWDGQWQSHFGGADTPNNRNGYYPSAFTPKENPFYFALPYSDITENGQRKSNAGNCALKNTKSLYSWCKNSWLAIRHNGKIVYAQWEDVGPNNEDDAAYVFGTSGPTNTFDARAGLDVSPAVRDYLGLGDVDHADWGFVAASDVPPGPWKNIITISQGDNSVDHN